MTPETIGFVGLGQMGGPMAANIAAGGFGLVVFDKAGSETLAPAGTRAAATLDELAIAADSIFLSLPDGEASLEVLGSIGRLAERRVGTVIDLSTTGPEAARAAAEKAGKSGIEYIDAPVSGGQAGARAGTVTLMWSGSEAALEAHRAIAEAFCGNVFHVGPEPGQGQALKLLNNFLSGTAMAATSEAILFGLSQGLEMKTMLEVVNVSTGRNSASLDKFPDRILTGSYDAGFKTALQTKDVSLFLENARAAGTPHRVGSLIAELWRACDQSQPDSDFTRIYDFIRDEDGQS